MHTKKKQAAKWPGGPAARLRICGLQTTRALILHLVRLSLCFSRSAEFEFKWHSILTKFGDAVEEGDLVADDDDRVEA